VGYDGADQPRLATGVTPEGFIRKSYGLNPEGTALLGQLAPAQESEAPVRTFMDDAIASVMQKAKEVSEL
jgi:hypothetical protein